MSMDILFASAAPPSMNPIMPFHVLLAGVDCGWGSMLCANGLAKLIMLSHLFYVLPCGRQLKRTFRTTRRTDAAAFNDPRPVYSKSLQMHSITILIDLQSPNGLRVCVQTKIAIKCAGKRAVKSNCNIIFISAAL